MFHGIDFATFYGLRFRIITSTFYYVKLKFSLSNQGECQLPETI